MVRSPVGGATARTRSTHRLARSPKSSRASPTPAGCGAAAPWPAGEITPTASQPAGRRLPQLSAGDYHTCGRRSDGTVACWGWNGYGQASPPIGTFTQINADFGHTCGIKSDGTLACWGYNEYGQATPPTGTFTRVGAGTRHTCGLRSDGTLACWGENVYGQASPPAGRFQRPVVGAGGSHTCGLRSDGTVACWGITATAKPARRPAPSPRSARAPITPAGCGATAPSPVGG